MSSALTPPSRPVQSPLMRAPAAYDMVEVDAGRPPRAGSPRPMQPLQLTLCSAVAALTLLNSPASPARADQVLPSGDAPLISIRSNGGVVRIVEGDAGSLRITGGATPNVSRFRVSRQADGRVWLPSKNVRTLVGGSWRTVRMRARQWMVPGLRDGGDGFNIENPGGGEFTVAVPRHHGALFLNAGSSHVVLERTHGPYVIDSTDGGVELRGVVGRGLVRTESGTVDLTNVGGQIVVISANGRIVSRDAVAERVEARSMGGDIDWVFARLGHGAYHFATDTGDIRIALRTGMGALVDAQSAGGTVANDFAPGAADVRVANDHQLALSLGGGGPQITAQSKRGSIAIGPFGER